MACENAAPPDYRACRTGGQGPHGYPRRVAGVGDVAAAEHAGAGGGSGWCRLDGLPGRPLGSPRRRSHRAGRRRVPRRAVARRPGLSSGSCGRWWPAPCRVAARRARQRPSPRTSRSAASGSLASARAMTASMAAGRSAAQGGDGGRLVLQVRPHHADLLVAREGQVAGQALEEHAGQRVLVAATGGLGALDLLGSDVVDGADEGPGGRELDGRGGVLRQAEVGQVAVLGPVGAGVARDEDVAGLDVAVDEAADVRGVERAGDLGGDRERALGLERGRRARAARAGPCPRRSAC